MSRLVNLLSAKLKSIIIPIKWRIDTFFLIRRYKKKSLTTRPKRLDLKNYENILIIVPHADDDIIGNFPIMISHKPLFFFYVGVYESNDYALIERRNEEFMNLISYLGHRVVSHDSPSHIRNIAKAISDFNISAVFTPDFLDWHKDHQQATIYLLEALKILKQKIDIFTFTIIVPHSPLGDNKYYMTYTSEQQEFKWSGLFRRFYPSQSFMPITRFKANERINAFSVPTKAQAADIYRLYTIDEIISSFDKRPQGEERSKIYGLINDLMKIHLYRECQEE